VGLAEGITRIRLKNSRKNFWIELQNIKRYGSKYSKGEEEALMGTGVDYEEKNN
jgi:hypothetical protein